MKVKKATKAKGKTRLKQIDGKLDSPAAEIQGAPPVQKFVPTTLDQILGVKGDSKYGTMDEQEYTARINGMSMADLYYHAVNVAEVAPTENRERLLNRLLSRFRGFVASFQRPANPSKLDPKKITPAIMKILAEGK